MVGGDAVGACSDGDVFSAELTAGVTALGLADLALGGGRGGNCTQSPAAACGAVGFGVLVSAGADGGDAGCAGVCGVATVAAVVMAVTGGRFFLAGRAGK